MVKRYLPFDFLPYFSLLLFACHRTRLVAPFQVKQRKNALRGYTTATIILPKSMESSQAWYRGAVTLQIAGCRRLRRQHCNGNMDSAK